MATRSLLKVKRGDRWSRRPLVIGLLMWFGLALSGCSDVGEDAARAVDPKVPEQLRVALLPSGDMVLFRVDCAGMALEQTSVYGGFGVFSAPEGDPYLTSAQLFTLEHAPGMVTEHEAGDGLPAALLVGVITEAEEALFSLPYAPTAEVQIFPENQGEGYSGFPCLSGPVAESAGRPGATTGTSPSPSTNPLGNPPSTAVTSIATTTPGAATTPAPATNPPTSDDLGSTSTTAP